MCNTSSNFRVSNFRNRVVACLLLTILSFSFVPSVSMAQQPTATIKTLSGDVLVSGQTATVETILQAGDTIQTQAGASVVLELSDGSELHLSENIQITLADLVQTSTGARVSRVKLLWGRIRAFLSPQHQIKGSSFDIETPNALIGVKFSEPDIEVSYSLEKAETVGIAHTVELLAKNLLTNEDVLVPVGSTVIITSTTTKVLAGILASAESTGTGATGAESASTGPADTGSAGMGTGKKVAIGIGAAAAAGGVAALAASSGDGGESETAESTGDLSGYWQFSGICVAQGCTDDLVCPPDHPEWCGMGTCDACDPNWAGQVTLSNNTLSGVMSGALEHRLSGVINGSSVSITITPASMLPAGPDTSTNYTGVIDGNTIRGDFTGSGDVGVWGGGSVFVTWSGTFTVTIRKE